MNPEYFLFIPILFLLTEIWFENLQAFAQLENQLEQKVLQERMLPSAAFSTVPAATLYRRLFRLSLPLRSGWFTRLLLFAAVALPFARTGHDTYPELLILGMWSLCFTIARIDFQWYIIPDELNWMGLSLGLCAAVASDLLGVAGLSLMESLGGALFGAGTLLSIATLCTRFLGRESMGGGDVKLMLFIGSILGIQGGLVTLALSSITGSFFGLFFLFKARVLEKKKGLTMIAFGPWIILAALITAYLSPQTLLDTYVQFSSNFVESFLFTH